MRSIAHTETTQHVIELNRHGKRKRGRNFNIEASTNTRHASVDLGNFIVSAHVQCGHLALVRCEGLNRCFVETTANHMSHVTQAEITD